MGRYDLTDEQWNKIKDYFEITNRNDKPKIIMADGGYHSLKFKEQIRLNQAM